MAQHNMLLIFCFVLFFKYSDGQLEGQMGQRNIQNGGYQQRMIPQCPSEWQWPCRDGECIPNYDLCDGVPQCADGSDEWNCDQMRMNQQRAPKFNNYGMGNRYLIPDAKPAPAQGTQPVASTTTAKPSTETVSSTSYITLSKKDLVISFAIFVVLAGLIFTVVRRRARRRALSRNRRGFIPRDDSDEDDLLIRSMYS